MLFISRLKRPWSCFSTHFCFLVFAILLSIVLSVLFLMAIISPLLWFFHTSVSWWSFTRVQVIASFRYPSQYFSRSQQCCSLDGHNLSSDFQLFQSPFQIFWVRYKHSNYNWYHRHCHVPHLIFLERSKYLPFVLLFLIFTQWFKGRQSSLHSKFSLFANNH